ncbi:MAG: hypothetical protein ACLSHG_00265 [Oscillospiraceae bacterium]
MIANCSASPEAAGKPARRRTLLRAASARGLCGYVYANAGPDVSRARAPSFPRTTSSRKTGTSSPSTRRSRPEPGLLVTELRPADALRPSAGATRPSYPRGRGRAPCRFPCRCARRRSAARCRRTRSCWTMQPCAASAPSFCFPSRRTACASASLHTSSRVALLPVTDDLDSVPRPARRARTMDLLGRARHDVLAVTQPGATGARAAPVQGAGRVRAAERRPRGASRARTRRSCSPRPTSRGAAAGRGRVRAGGLRRQRRRAAHARALAHRGRGRARGSPLRAELRAALSAPDANCAGVSCALTDFCFYHLVRCGAHPRRIL